MRNILKKIVSFSKEENGATAVEYALMAALIASVIALAVTTLGQNTNAGFNAAATEMQNAVN